MFLPCKLIALRYLLQQWKPDWEHTSSRLPEKTQCVDLRVSHSKQKTLWKHCRMGLSIEIGRVFRKEVILKGQINNG